MFIGGLEFIKICVVSCARRIVQLLEVLFPSVFNQLWIGEHDPIFVFHCSHFGPCDQWCAERLVTLTGFCSGNVNSVFLDIWSSLDFSAQSIVSPRLIQTYIWCLSAVTFRPMALYWLHSATPLENVWEAYQELQRLSRWRHPSLTSKCLQRCCLPNSLPNYTCGQVIQSSSGRNCLFCYFRNDILSDSTVTSLMCQQYAQYKFPDK